MNSCLSDTLTQNAATFILGEPRFMRRSRKEATPSLDSTAECSEIWHLSPGSGNPRPGPRSRFRSETVARSNSRTDRQPDGCGTMSVAAYAIPLAPRASQGSRYAEPQQSELIAAMGLLYPTFKGYAPLSDL
jgi:hypothetical protein